MGRTAKVILVVALVVTSITLVKLPAITLAVGKYMFEPTLQRHNIALPWAALQANWIGLSGSNLQGAFGPIPIVVDRLDLELGHELPLKLLLRADLYGGSLRGQLVPLTWQLSPASLAGPLELRLAGIDLATMPLPAFIGAMQGSLTAELTEAKLKDATLRAGAIRIVVSGLSFRPSIIGQKQLGLIQFEGATLSLDGQIDDTARITASGRYTSSLAQGIVEITAQDSRHWQLQSDVLLTDEGLNQLQERFPHLNDARHLRITARSDRPMTIAPIRQ